MRIQSYVVSSNAVNDIYRVEMGLRHAYVAFVVGKMITEGDMRAVALDDEGQFALHLLTRLGRSRPTLIMVSSLTMPATKERIAFGLSRASSGDVLAVFFPNEVVRDDARRHLRIDDGKRWIGRIDDEGDWLYG